MFDCGAGIWSPNNLKVSRDKTAPQKQEPTVTTSTTRMKLLHSIQSTVMMLSINGYILLEYNKNKCHLLARDYVVTLIPDWVTRLTFVVSFTHFICLPHKHLHVMQQKPWWICWFGIPCRNSSDLLIPYSTFHCSVAAPSTNINQYQPRNLQHILPIFLILIDRIVPASQFFRN